MHITFIINGLTGGGAERVLVTLANRFVSDGKQVSIVITDTLAPCAYELDNRVRLVYMLNNRPPVKKNIFNKIHRHLWYYYAIRKSVVQEKTDIAISFLTAQNVDSIKALFGTGIPLIVSEHSNVDRVYSKSITRNRKLFYPFASAITVLTRNDYEKWRNTYKNVYYLTNPIEIERTENFNERRKNVIAVGRVKQWDIKGFDTLLSCWKDVKGQCPGWDLEIIGDYDDKAIQSLSEVVGCNVTEIASFLGFRTDVKEYMSRSSVFCLSSRVEGMPMALLEAMSKGCCCVAFDCVTGPSEIIEDHKNGLLVENQNLEELRLSLLEVVRNEKMRLEYSLSAPNVISKYSLDSITGQWYSLFNKIKK